MSTIKLSIKIQTSKLVYFINSEEFVVKTNSLMN